MADATTQSKPPTKDTRLVVRLEAEDLNFVREEGEKLSLDASTWVRMMIRKLRLGHIHEWRETIRGGMRAAETAGIVEPSPGMSWPVARPDFGASVNGADFDEHSTVPDETLDTDDLVARKMREADQKGLTQPRAAQDDAGMGDEFEEFTGGIRPVGDRKSWKTGSPKDFRPE